MTKIHATAVVDPSAQLGEDVEIGPFCVVGGDVQLGDRVKLRSHVSVDGHTVLGEGCDVHPFAALGGAPQHLGYKGEPTRLEIGAGTVIRESVTMNRGTANGDAVTRIGKNGFFMAYSHVAHDCIVGDGVVFANSATLAGHCHVGDGVIIGGLSAVHQHCRIGTGAIVGGVSGVAKDVIPFGSVLGARAELGGLNIIGLKRRGFPREQIHALRNAYKGLFSGEGTLKDRVEAIAETYKGEPLVETVVAFIRGNSDRSYCVPRGSETG